MRDYILFIDTEGSGWPKKWNVPYSDKNNWPYSVQIAWIIYDKDGNEVKSEDHYIGDNDFKIEPSSYKIHGIDEAFLVRNGEPRQQVMMLLADDMLQYQPLLVGHFMDLDMRMIGADFYRSGVANISLTLPTFCTMKSTTQFSENPNVKYLRLSQLYNTLFDKEQPGQHNALADARAAAECFFELVGRGAINDEKIEEANAENARNGTKKSGCGVFVLGIVVLIIVIIWLS